ncbi:MAG: class I tRNA ligase family protein [Patescibacteria group bacterium]
MPFPKIDPKQSFPKMEEEILAFWQREKIFEKSLARNPATKEFKFFDGPPFATGLPHYGHILQGVIKDLIPRYKTMQGYHVPRIWGWDCHGLPVENLIEKELGLKSKKDIEEFGVAKFNEKCRESVLKFAGEWEKTVARMGRWIDMEHAYKTMDLEFMDSVWWVFGELWNKGLIYEGLKPMQVCPRCATPLANFEVGLNYKDVTDLSAIAKFAVEGEPNTFLLAWTTTPWTLPGNVALAVNPEIEYVKVETKNFHEEVENFWIAKEIFENWKEKEIYLFKRSVKELSERETPEPVTKTFLEIKIIETKKGSDLVGKTYKPLFNYFAEAAVNPRVNSGVNGISDSGVNDNSKDNFENIPGLYFITFNTENSEPIFADSKLKDICAEAFREVAEKNNYKIYELAIMPDHVHLVIEIEEGGESLPKILQNLKGFSSKILKSSLTPELTRGLTVRQDSQGHEYSPIWRQGYDKKFIYSEDEYSKVSDYIRQNPEKKNLPPQKYAWLKIFDDVNQPIKFAEQKPQGFRVVAADFITTDEGTGIVHIAPAFGEDDYNLAKKEHLPIFQNVSLDGRYTDAVTDFVGVEVKPKDDPTKTDRKIVEFLGDQIFATQNYKHSYPFCWRCESPLLNYATSSWFVAVEKLKAGLIKNNSGINWIPEHIKTGRFGKWLEGARDWAISRNRFWGAPLPIWRCEKCGELKCLSGKAELEKLSGKKVADLHKHFVDAIEIPCEKCDGKMQRIPEVLDCWFESGSMPFAQFGEKEKAQIPADFIAEAQDQTRGWFYTLHVLATALANKPAYANCVCSGLILAEDGAKMSKSKQNFPPPQKIFDEFGADAMRLYLMNSPVTHAADLRFSERGVEEILRGVLLPLWNTFYFFTTYANADGWEPTKNLELKTQNKLDAWILSELNILVREMTTNLEQFEIQKAVAPLEKFLDGLTNWYVRRSRRRFWRKFSTGTVNPRVNSGVNSDEIDSDKNAAYATLFEVLKTVAKLLAPITPFLAEKIWQNLTGGKSVHLESWPKVEENLIDENLSAEVDTTRKIISLGLKIRANEKIKVRQPLAKMTVALSQKVELDLETIREELNVKNLEIAENPDTIAEQSVEVNARAAGKKFGAKIQKIIAAAKAVEFEIVDGGVKILDEILSGEEITIGFRGKSGAAVESEDGIVVALDTKITPELELEGQARDLVRAIQELRKQADFDVADRIELQLENADAILEKFADYIAAETLATKVVRQLANPAASGGLEAIKIGVRKVDS